MRKGTREVRRQISKVHRDLNGNLNGHATLIGAAEAGRAGGGRIEGRIGGRIRSARFRSRELSSG